jgi:hypothetical protein
MAKTAISTVKEYFSTPEKPVTNAELIALKKAAGTENVLTTLAEGINNGTFTY